MTDCEILYSSIIMTCSFYSSIYDWTVWPAFIYLLCCFWWWWDEFSNWYLFKQRGSDVGIFLVDQSLLKLKHHNWQCVQNSFTFGLIRMFLCFCSLRSNLEISWTPLIGIDYFHLICNLHFILPIYHHTALFLSSFYDDYYFFVRS